MVRRLVTYASIAGLMLISGALLVVTRAAGLPETVTLDSCGEKTKCKERHKNGYPLGQWWACRECHPAHVPKAAEGARPCLDCHEKDMTPSREVEFPLDLMQADGYRVAFHENCIPCHKKEAEKAGRSDLGDCATCHETLRPREASARAPVLAARLR
jgi:hypothetical protein